MFNQAEMEISRRANPRKGRGGIDIAIGYGEKGHKIQYPPLHWLVRREKKIQREKVVVKRPSSHSKVREDARA
jgi:hypothetical protein